MLSATTRERAAKIENTEKEKKCCEQVHGRRFDVPPELVKKFDDLPRRFFPEERRE
jgi:hypothetical protein